MQAVSKPNDQQWKRSAAGLTVAILLLVQSFGAAHFHPLPSQRKYVANAAVSVDGLCALCLVRFHSQAAFVVTPHPTAPALAQLTERSATRTAVHSSNCSHLFGRAPPASI